MILRCSYEELAALTATARRVLDDVTGRGAVVAPPELAVELETLLPRLEGDLEIETLAAQRRLQRVFDYLLDVLQDRVDRLILDQYVGSDDAVNAYFEYANILTLATKLREIGDEMESLIELMTGSPPTEEAARSITFTD